MEGMVNVSKLDKNWLLKDCRAFKNKKTKPLYVVSVGSLSYTEESF